MNRQEMITYYRLKRDNTTDHYDKLHYNNILFLLLNEDVIDEMLKK